MRRAARRNCCCRRWRPDEETEGSRRTGAGPQKVGRNHSGRAVGIRAPSRSAGRRPEAQADRVPALRDVARQRAGGVDTLPQNAIWPVPKFAAFAAGDQARLVTVSSLRAANSTAAGSSISTRRPGFAFAARIEPWWIWIARRAMDSPSPTPPLTRLRSESTR